MNAAASHQVWLDGAKAARAGTAVTDCPYPPVKFESVVWTNGWAATRHHMAAESARTSRPATVTPIDDDLFGDDNSDLF